MKITSKHPTQTQAQTQHSPDRPNKPIRPTSRRKTRKPGPPTPLLRWKFDEDVNSSDNVAGEKSPENITKKDKASSRKIGAAIWRSHLPDPNMDPGRGPRGRGGGVGDQLGFKPVVDQGCDRLSHHHASRDCGSEAKDLLKSPCSVNGPINGYHCKRQSPHQLSNYAMEGVTKWDPVCLKTSLIENSNDVKIITHKVNAASVIPALEAELQQAQARIEELESERRSSKKKLEHFLKKLSEEKAVWRSREHEKLRAIIDDIKDELGRERKNRQRLEIVNSKVVNELNEAKLSVKRYMQDYEKEKKARELIEEVCDELAKEIGEDKAEVDSLKQECLRVREEIEDERRMLQMAEVWREERVQMKLIDAKVTLDQKFSQMDELIIAMKKFLISKGATLNANEMRETEILQREADSVKIKDIKEFIYEPSKSDDLFAMVEEMALAEGHEREIEPCAEYKVHDLSPGNNSQSKSSIDEGSGWETVSHGDQGSSYSPEGSTLSANNMCTQNNNVFEWEEKVSDEKPITEITEICPPIQPKQVKKVKSITRLWRSCPSNNNGDNCKIISVDGVNEGRLSNGRVSTDQGISNPLYTIGWSSPDSRNTQNNRGMKGCIEWPLGAQKNSLKHKLLEAKVERQKIQLRHILKQQI